MKDLDSNTIRTIDLLTVAMSLLGWVGMVGTVCYLLWTWCGR